MHPTIAQGFVQHHQAALHQEAEQSRLAAQARAGRPGQSWLERVTALAGRVQGVRPARRRISAPPAPQLAAMEVLAHGLAADDALPGVDPLAAGPRRPASWARTRTVAFGPAGRTLSGPPDVTPPSPAL
jgi:hypothetical protein